ncbi:MAG: phosphate ABC transporter permease subunit PstC [Candidatus Marinimicrobia bacterium]|nr:phosphate ABC transporter permease subunit PstC [Candidatus Neomarinimicrobiota bacterium]
MINWREKIIQLLLVGAASASILIVLLIFLSLGKEALPFMSDPGIGRLLEYRWIPVSFKREVFGIIPLITGSVLVTILATGLMIPFGVLGAVYIAEIAVARERAFLKPFIEIMAGIPSVVIGFFGLVILNPVLKEVFQLKTGLTALSGAILLALMAIPTVISISEDAIRSVPKSIKEASLALGASRLQTIFRVVVPAALPGIIAAVMLGIGRVVGETMVVLMVTGNAAKITFNPVDSVRTMTATIAAEMGEVAFGSDHYQALFWVGIVLLVITFTLNYIAQKVLNRYRMK